MSTALLLDKRQTHTEALQLKNLVRQVVMSPLRGGTRPAQGWTGAGGTLPLASCLEYKEAAAPFLRRLTSLCRLGTPRAREGRVSGLGRSTEVPCAFLGAPACSELGVLHQPHRPPSLMHLHRQARSVASEGPGVQTTRPSRRLTSLGDQTFRTPRRR